MVTGPTGSGKTTTLYSIVQHLNNVGVNIMTLEDPVEYPLPMIRQSAVSENTKMDWASGIKSLLRQDPDILLIGEVRDNETAELVFRAAMTGHVVLTTLHTNSAIGVIPRLTDMGVLPDIMATNISGIVAQRLVRKLCVKCKRKKENLSDLDKAVLPKLYPDVDFKKSLIQESVGCAVCEYQGYRGRAAVMELLRFNDELDEMVSQRATIKEFRERASRTGLFFSMAESGAEKVVSGETSLEEIGRVVDLTPYMN